MVREDTDAMTRRTLGKIAIAASCALTSARAASAQSPLSDPPGSPGASSLGPSPGSRGDSASSGVGGILSGRAGLGAPRAPTSVTRPGQGSGGSNDRRGVTMPEALPIADVPIYGTLALPGDKESDGPSDGLTLDAAIARLLRENLDLMGQSFEIPQAQADVLTASLRANPVLYADSQLVPYGNFSPQKPGGSTQYDVNISYPFDLSRKRQARTEAACRAKRVIEAQFQDAARLQIDNLYVAYVNVLAARETVDFARAGVRGLDVVLERVAKQLEQGALSRGQVSRVKIQRDAAKVGLADAEESLRKAQRTLIPLLRLTPREAESLELRGSIRDTAPAPPPGEDLLRIALESRPDLAAFRLGVGRAQSDVKVALAERYQDIYVLYQPYTFQNNAPFDTQSAHSWGVGVTVPLPIYNRNQGNILKARQNVAQTRTELSALELRIVGEVREAEREYAVSKAAVEEVERNLLPEAREFVSEALQQWERGEGGLVDFLLARREYNDIVRQYRDTLIRHRRSMLAINTAVGQRLLP